MVKLQKLNHNPQANKLENNMRATHLKLDPIETQISTSFVNPVGPPGGLTVTNNDSKPLNASVQFNKGMLSPIDSVKLPSSLNNQTAQLSPNNMKNKAKINMNTSMYRNMNQGVAASQNVPPQRRLNDSQISPLTAFELEREQTQQRIYSTYITPNQKPSAQAQQVSPSN